MGRWRYYSQYNLSSGTPPLILHTLKGKFDSDHVTWGYRTPKDAEEKRRPWINGRIEKALAGRCFRHMFREGRVIVPEAAGSNEPLKTARSSPGIITRKDRAPIFMAGLTNFRPYTRQTVEVGFVIVTQDCEGGMVDIHDRSRLFWNGGRLALDGR